MDSEFKDIFETDSNDKSKVFCKYCKNSHVPSSKDLRKHLETEKYIENVKNYKDEKPITDYARQHKTIREEIMWAHFTAMMNLSFQLTDSAKIVLPDIFFDSDIAKNIIMNRKKTKKLIIPIQRRSG